MRAWGEIRLRAWHADCFPGTSGCIYWAAEPPKRYLAWGPSPPAHYHLICEAPWAGVHSQRVSHSLPASLLYLSFHRGVRVHLPPPTRTNTATWQGNPATESAGRISRQLVIRNAVWPCLLPEIFKPVRLVQEETLGVCVMEKMQTAFQEKHWDL